MNKVEQYIEKQKQIKNLIKEKLAATLIRVGELEGVVATHGKDDISIQGGHFDDYLLVYLLGTLIKEDKMDFDIELIAEDKQDYFLKLLHINREEVKEPNVILSV